MLQSPLKWIILCGPVNLGANFDFCQENYFCLAEQVVALKNYGGGSTAVVLLTSSIGAIFAILVSHFSRKKQLSDEVMS
jgi:hypothetical protein